MTPSRRRAGALAAAILALHVIGFGTLLLAVVPRHFSLGHGAVFGLGLGITAYTLGLRHAFDADHIAAIDNTTRRLMSEGKRPLGVGFSFSLGHSTVVFGLTLLLALGFRAIGPQVDNAHSTLHALSNIVGTGVSGAFLYLIAAINVTILIALAKLLRGVRHGRLDEAELERRLSSRGLLNRLLGRFAQNVSSSWQMYPVGFLFGLGFDTATEVALLFLAAGAASSGLPFYALLCLPVLFAAGMSLFDTLDGSLDELRLRLGLRRAGSQGLLQPHDDRLDRDRRVRGRHGRAAGDRAGQARAARRLLGLGDEGQPGDARVLHPGAVHSHVAAVGDDLEVRSDRTQMATEHAIGIGDARRGWPAYKEFSQMPRGLRFRSRGAAEASAPLSLLPDGQLVALARQNDSDAFAVIYDRHATAAYSLAHRICGTRALAEDVVQEAFLSLWRRLDGYDAARGEVRSWLLGIVHNGAIDKLRQSAMHERRRASGDGLEDRLESPERTEVVVAQREQANEIQAALRRLPPEQRRVIELAYFEGLTHTEIAAHLELPVGTIKGRMRLGLAKLAGILSVEDSTVDAGGVAL